MADRNGTWADILTRLLALAATLEDEGQYKLAKPARAAAESLGRQTAHALVGEVRTVFHLQPAAAPIYSVRDVQTPTHDPRPEFCYPWTDRAGTTGVSG